ncbi:MULTISPECIES: hypothetical protein [Psychrobacter]|mgnify:CR=1 FL=1|jgi:hypothetical protein|uniref:Lipoprotein n=1 Tax=Psychrobacter immobilis TaxID=498 RepID=A0A2V2A043_PSYIM|nr:MULTISPECIES: hypothetical protein [Psychrobacter]MDN5560690.1 hypothetical protein [Psychrobacter sp.]KRG34394.1 hypothetical protein AK822_05705 [Psychrobacter sp. P11F6]MCG3808381.1 hypothetical protein [Psychrobacter sp. Ps4]MCG3872223.1 hypothetical protein [Psychrobacter sp. Ps7]PWK11469.1 hypothetical protein C8D84_108110 [Psychrobacter immobilis]
MNTINKTAALTATLAAALALSACQTTPSSPVIQRANSIYETTGIADSKVKAQQNAIDSAQKTCRGKQVIIVDDKVTYNGILDENTGRMIGQASAVLGTILGTGSPNLSRDDDYEYKINFRCQ